MPDDSEVARQVAALAGHLGTQLLDERRRRRLTLREVAARSGLSRSLVQWLETGHPGRLESYVRLGAALGLRPDFGLVDARRRAQIRAEDPVHASMGEWSSAKLLSFNRAVALDEPFQHYQFAGRADVIAWSMADLALLHIENRTRFPNLQEAFGSYNAKRRYLPAVVAERLGIRGFRSVAHVMVGLWSSEVLHAVRIHRASFHAVCPDGPEPFEAWMTGRIPTGVTSSFVLLDPAARGALRAYVGGDKVAAARPRYRGYADAVTAVALPRH
jgi:transcriptional regulator with XRE-family HTH domain